MLGIFQNFDFFLSPTSGSFHFVFFVCQSDHEQKNQLSCLFIFCIKKSTFCLKMTADIFRFFDHFDQKRKTKNEMNLTIKIKVFHPLFHSTFYHIGGMQACKSTTYTHTEKKPTAELILDFCGWIVARCLACYLVPVTELLLPSSLLHSVSVTIFSL